MPNWTGYNSWRLKKSKQIRVLPQDNIYVAVVPGITGDLTDARASAYVAIFTDCTWGTIHIL